MNNDNISNEKQCLLFDEELEELGCDEKDWYNQRILEHITKYPNKKHKEYYPWFQNKHNQGNHRPLRSVPSKQFLHNKENPSKNQSNEAVIQSV